MEAINILKKESQSSSDSFDEFDTFNPMRINDSFKSPNLSPGRKRKMDLIKARKEKKNIRNRFIDIQMKDDQAKSISIQESISSIKFSESH